MEGSPGYKEENHNGNCKLRFISRNQTEVSWWLTKHVNNLSPAVIDRPQSLVVQSPHCGPSHVALPSSPDHDDHVGVEIYEETDWQHKEDDKG